MSTPRDSEKLLEAAARRDSPVQQDTAQRPSATRRVAMVAAMVLATMLIVSTLCACIKHDAFRAALSRWGAHGDAAPELFAGDCRRTGCQNGFVCTPSDASIACFMAPCPASLYTCVPPDMVGKPDATAAAILAPAMAQASPEAAPADGDKVTEAFYACTQSHGGQATWKQPGSECNTCRCTPRGTVVCTKMLCLSKARA
ncbi:hypothetical protein IWQ56_002503 [Coemansia nantahalensis]|nr:hypothetical protein IWQ56_002503 [Coemansia nantahalensis]